MFRFPLLITHTSIHPYIHTAQAASVSIRAASVSPSRLTSVVARLVNVAGNHVVGESDVFTIPYANPDLYPYPSYTIPFKSLANVASEPSYFVNITYAGGDDLFIGARYNIPSCASAPKDSSLGNVACTAFYRQGIAWTSQSLSYYLIALNANGPLPVDTSASFQCGMSAYTSTVFTWHYTVHTTQRFLSLRIQLHGGFTMTVQCNSTVFIMQIPSRAL